MKPKTTIESMIEEWKWEVKNSQYLWLSVASDILNRLEKGGDLKSLKEYFKEGFKKSSPCACSIYYERALWEINTIIRRETRNAKKKLASA